MILSHDRIENRESSPPSQQLQPIKPQQPIKTSRNKEDDIKEEEIEKRK